MASGGDPSLRPDGEIQVKWHQLTAVHVALPLPYRAFLLPRDGIRWCLAACGA